MSMKKKERIKGERVLLAAFLLMSNIFLSGCQSERETFVTTKQEETSLEESSESRTTEVEKEKEIDWTEEIFTGESVFISYPVFSFQKNIDADTINQRIQEDALRILEYFDVNMESDTLDITYEIADITEDWISIVYCGSYSRADAAYPIAVKYTSNLSLADGFHLQLAQMENVEELAQRMIEGNFRVIGEDEEIKAAICELVERMELEELAQNLEAADFGMESYEAYPEWFSFWSTIEGETQISIVMPVVHVLGDYAVLEVFLEGEEESK